MGLHGCLVGCEGSKVDNADPVGGCKSLLWTFSNIVLCGSRSDLQLLCCVNGIVSQVFTHYMVG